MSFCRKIKERLYHFFVERNVVINELYTSYVIQHIDEHKKYRLRRWGYLLSLYWKTLRKSDKRLTKKTILKKSVEPRVIIKEVYVESKKMKDEEIDKMEKIVNESERVFIRKPIHLAKALLRYDVVSFDVFDTLVFRPFVDPKNIFSIIGERLSVLNFCNYRIMAEKKARELMKMNYGTIEVSLEDIYAVLEELTGIDAEEGLKKELEVEFELIYANPYMKRVYDLLVEHGVRVIAVSDMYLDGEKIKQLLEKNGYCDFEKIYSSVDYACSKSNKKLYQIVKNDYEGKKICHIGDNFKSDVEMARESGLEAMYYRNINMLGREYRKNSLPSLVWNGYSALLNQKYYCGLEQCSMQYQIGYSYIGLYVLGYANWIYKYSKENGIDKILFLARDGYLYKEVFDMFHSDVQSEYVYWSRAASIKCNVRENWSLFLMHFFEHKAHEAVKCEIGRHLEKMGLGELIPKLKKYKIQPHEELDDFNLTRVKLMLNENKDLICKAFYIEQKSLEEYIKYVIGDSKRIAIIDIGWSGSVLLPLKAFINKAEGGDIDVSCLMAAGRPFNATFASNAFSSGVLKAYMFSPDHNRDLYEWHKTNNNGLNTFFVELFTQASDPSFLGFKNGEFVFDFPEVENYDLNAEIHRGIFDFSKDYMSKFGNVESMHDISGYDAYSALMQLLRQPMAIYECFGEYTFSRGVLSASKDRVETVREIMEKANLVKEA